MIASLLPGLRDLRTPLAAGYLWLLFGWLLVEPSLPSPGDELTGVTASISRLIDEVGGTAVGVGISFAAYVLGTVYSGLLRAPQAVYRWRFARRGFRMDEGWVTKISYATALSARGLDALEEYVTQTLTGLAPRVEALDEDDDSMHEFYKRKGLLSEGDFFGLAAYFAPVAYIPLKEFDLLKLRLLRRSPELFAEVDRGSAEAEFRLAIVPPLAALAALLALEDSPLWAIAMSILPVLIAQGIARGRAAGDRLVDALVLDEIKSPLLEELEKTLDNALAAKKQADE